MGAFRGGQMPPCRESEDSHTVRVEVPFFCPVPDHEDGPLGVLQWSDLPINHCAVIRNPVFKDNGSNACFIKSSGYIISLMAGCNNRIPTAGADHYCRPVCLLL